MRSVRAIRGDDAGDVDTRRFEEGHQAIGIAAASAAAAARVDAAGLRDDDLVRREELKRSCRAEATREYGARVRAAKDALVEMLRSAAPELAGTAGG